MRLIKSLRFEKKVEAKATQMLIWVITWISTWGLPPSGGVAVSTVKISEV